MAEFTIEASGASVGATVRGLDLRTDLDADTAAQVRAGWLRHQVLVFPDQDLSVVEFEAVATAFGPIGEDPYFRAMDDTTPVVELKREADETTPIFADVLHSDWSFLPSPPAGTLLYGLEIPPTGGDTIFADQYGAYDALPESLKERIESLVGIHSARYGYAKKGAYGERDVGRSMSIISSDEALATQPHPLVRVHPETGRRALFCSLAYTIGIEGLDEAEGNALLGELFGYIGAEARLYRHRWEPGMVVLWDNRCLLHAATGGYEGHRRVLHRLTIAERPS